MRYPTQYQVDQIKKRYPVGTRIRLYEMEDPYAPIEAGTEGDVVYVDDMGTLHMKWDNGRSLGVDPFADRFEVVSIPEEKQLDMEEEVEQKIEQEIGGMSL